MADQAKWKETLMSSKNNNRQHQRTGHPLTLVDSSRHWKRSVAEIEERDSTISEEARPKKIQKSRGCVLEKLPGYSTPIVCLLAEWESNPRI